jgi:hypothetical protein
MGEHVENLRLVGVIDCASEVDVGSSAVEI